MDKFVQNPLICAKIFVKNEAISKPYLINNLTVIKLICRGKNFDAGVLPVSKKPFWWCSIYICS